MERPASLVPATQDDTAGRSVLVLVILSYSRLLGAFGLAGLDEDEAEVAGTVAEHAGQDVESALKVGLGYPSGMRRTRGRSRDVDGVILLLETVSRERDSKYS